MYVNTHVHEKLLSEPSYINKISHYQNKSRDKNILNNSLLSNLF